MADARIWLAIVTLAMNLTAWLQLLTPGRHPSSPNHNACAYACSRSPDASHDAPARSIYGCRRMHPWGHLITTAIDQLHPAPT